MQKFLHAAIGIAAPFAATAQGAPPPQNDSAVVAEQPASAEQVEIDRINQKYQGEYQQIENQTDDLEKKGDICGSGTVKWDVTTTAFDVPEVTMKTRRFSFDTIKTTFKNRGFSLDLPDCRWKIRNIGFGIKTKLWSCGMKRQDFSTKIPEFRKARTDFSFNIPEFRKKRIEWKYHMLKIMSLDSISASCKELEGEGIRIQKQTEEINKNHMAELRPVLRKQIQDGLAEMSRSAMVAEQDMAAALADMDKSIAELAKNGQNPATIMTEVDGQQVSLVDARAQIARQRTDLQTLLAQQQAEMEARLVELDQGLTA
ncbi:hypothetical protein ACQHGV_01020 [Sphingomonas pseudosanguinis]|uniref:hypothetical protein n=1 Tax=Sphingomonas pseudosanguinis TaxID=413712 RepID=UPI003F87545A